MRKKLLITGITGFIGRSVALKLLEYTDKYEITALVRPATSSRRISGFGASIQIQYIDLSETNILKDWLSKHAFDVVLHIGALRGGRKASKSNYYKSNVLATGQIVENALANKSKLIFCSSVGVFGAIPKELPANNQTEYQSDNYYHYTKIESEKLINRAIYRGLNAIILRPSITYGAEDNGFPFQLVKLTKSFLFPLSNKPIWIHLCNLETITAAILNSISKDKGMISAYNIADVEPIQLKDLVNFTSRQIHKRNYPQHLTIDNKFLRFGEVCARMIKNEKWQARFELISKSWFYNVSDAYRDLDLPQHFTIPDFEIAIKNYLSK